MHAVIIVEGVAVLQWIVSLVISTVFSCGVFTSCRQSNMILIKNHLGLLLQNPFIGQRAHTGYHKQHPGAPMLIAFSG